MKLELQPKCLLHTNRDLTRVRTAGGQGPTAALHKRAEVHPVGESREPHAQRPGQPPAAAQGQQAAQHGLLAQGVVRPALELPARGLGAPVFQQLVRCSQVATAAGLREVRGYDRASLGWHRGVLQAREQGRTRLRGRLQQQDPRHPAARLRPPRQGVPAAQDSHLYAASNLRDPCNFTQNHPFGFKKSQNKRG